MVDGWDDGVRIVGWRYLGACSRRYSYASRMSDLGMPDMRSATSALESHVGWRREHDGGGGCMGSFSDDWSGTVMLSWMIFVPVSSTARFTAMEMVEGSTPGGGARSESTHLAK